MGQDLSLRAEQGEQPHGRLSDHQFAPYSGNPASLERRAIAARPTRSRVFISGSSTGLGLMAARLLVEQGHRVVLHARDAGRADHVRSALPEAEAVVDGDLSTISGARDVAEQVNDLGRFHAVVHNAAIGYREARRILTRDGLSHVFAINTLAPYILTALIKRSARLVYLSSAMHHQADVQLEDLTWTRRRWRGWKAYAETKLHDVLLAFGVARRWPEVLSNAVDPGWVPTRMGGPSAPDDLDKAHRTQAWLAASDDPEARVSGKYFYRMHAREVSPHLQDPDVQERLLAACERLSGVKLV
jgi:NAD(P)-dependent dehydrogenase (short-subunit alcohol dehydrogenase family)